MYKILLIMAGMLVLTYSFVPRIIQDVNRYEVRDVKTTLNLASKSLVNAIDMDGVNYETFSLGYYLENEDAIQIDKNKLLMEFNTVLEKNTSDEKELKAMQRRIPIMFLSYGDRFYLAELKLSKPSDVENFDIDNWDVSYAWLPPIYYTVVDDLGRLIYLNSRDNIAYYYSGYGVNEVEVKVNIEEVWVDGKILTEATKDQIIIDKINSVVETKTRDYASGSGGFRIQINPEGFEDLDITGYTYDEKQEYYRKMNNLSNFNILEGITFFILYSDDEYADIDGNLLKYRNYQATGFTLSNRY